MALNLCPLSIVFSLTKQFRRLKISIQLFCAMLQQNSNKMVCRNSPKNFYLQFFKEPPWVYLFHILCTFFYTMRVYMKLKFGRPVVLIQRSPKYKLLATTSDRLLLNRGQTFMVCTQVSPFLVYLES